MSREELENQIATLTGGRAAEELVFHSITTGASNDIEKAPISRMFMNSSPVMVSFSQRNLLSSWSLAS